MLILEPKVVSGSGEKPCFFKSSTLLGARGSNAEKHSSDEFTETFNALQWKRLSKKSSDVPSLKFPVDL